MDVADDHLTVAWQSKAQTAEVNHLLNKHGYAVYSIHKVQKDLEKLFLDITQTPAK